MSTDHVEFDERTECIACGSKDFTTLDSGAFDADPLREFIEQDPWGVSPLPFLRGCTWEYVQCDRCSQMLQRKLLSEKWQEIKFRDWMSAAAIREFEARRSYDTADRLYQKGRQLTQHVVRIAAMTQGIRSTERVRLLDFGCGWGEFLSVAQSFGFEAFGIERAPDRMDHLRRRGIVVDEDLESVRKKTQGSFHAVTLFQVLEHLDNPLDLLKNLYPIMAPGAVLVLEVPNCEGVSGIRTLQDYYAIHPLEHFNCFTPKTLASIAQRAGFAPAHIDATHVTTSIKQVIKSQAKTLLERFRPRSTNQYFRKA